MTELKPILRVQRHLVLFFIPRKHIPGNQQVCEAMSLIVLSSIFRYHTRSSRRHNTSSNESEITWHSAYHGRRDWTPYYDLWLHGFDTECVVFWYFISKSRAKGSWKGVLLRAVAVHLTQHKKWLIWTMYMTNGQYDWDNVSCMVYDDALRGVLQACRQKFFLSPFDPSP